MPMFLAEVAQRHVGEFVFTVMGRAGWHLARQLEVPTTMRLKFVPPHRAESNPAESLWEALRQDCFANRLVAGLEAAEPAPTASMATLEADPARAPSVTGVECSLFMRWNAKLHRSARRGVGRRTRLQAA